MSCNLIDLFLRVSHLCSLFIDLRPVWLQSDDAVELVQSQVSILDVLAERTLEGDPKCAVSKKKKKTSIDLIKDIQE